MFMLQQKAINRNFTSGIVAVLLWITAGQTAFAQSSGNQFIRKGNKLYQKQDFTDAEAEYQKALSRDSVSSAGLFNLGNSLYQQKRYKEAAQQYGASIRNSASSKELSSAHYNLGNTFMSNKKWGEAINAYKQSLLKNPADENARYNLAYAREMLKKQKKSGGGKNNKQQNKNKNSKDKNKQDQNHNKNQNKDQQNPQNNKDQQDQQHPQPQPSKIDKQRADQLLNAAAQAEKKLQENRDKKQKGIPVKGGKDW